ncbi:MAG TPA: hypothetical protein VIV40_14945 [Kofleriaceae bacterium]
MAEIEHAGTTKAMPAIAPEPEPLPSEPPPTEASGEIVTTEPMAPLHTEDEVAWQRGMPPIRKP